MNDYHSLGFFVEVKPFRQTCGLPPSLSGTAFGSWEGSHERGAVTQ